ncbi:MAG: response regulator transcription factor [Planctomycetes bacterium]|nr:response regulator transcription factor [Planctomycetota bacterium]
MTHASHHHRILLVEDDAPLASMVADFLAPQGFDVAIEGRGDAAVARILSEQPDVVVLDVNLPGLDGLSVCRAVRAQYRGAIVMLTARGEEIDEVLGLEVGADDYLAKPVRPRALLARLRTHLRRSTATNAAELGQPITVGSLVVDASRRSVEIEGVELDLTSAEFELLQFLAENAGRTVSRNDIYQHIHGMKFDGLDRSIDLRISRLRKKVGDDPAKPKRIKSVRGVGYILASDP